MVRAPTRGATEKHGLRNELEHHPVSVEISTGQTGDEPPYVTAHIVHPNREPPSGAELFEAISDITVRDEHPGGGMAGMDF